MASKKDKEKIDSKSLVLKLESVIATSPTMSFVALTNKFSAFSPRSPISYSSTLASPYDPFVISSKNPDCLLLNMINPQLMLLFLITNICFLLK
jgi:hypothetical protein